MPHILTMDEIANELAATIRHFKENGKKLYDDLKPFLTCPIHCRLSYRRTWTQEFGLASIKRGRPRPYGIDFNGWLLSSIDDWHDTVHHEYAHIVHFMAIERKLAPRTTDFHDETWQAYAVACGANPTFGAKCAGVGVLDYVIEVRSAKATFAMTYADYRKRKQTLMKKKVTVRVADASEMLDRRLITSLSSIVL